MLRSNLIAGVTFLLLLLICTTVRGQVDSIDIEPISIIATPLLSTAAGIIVESWNKAHSNEQQNLSDFLNNNTSIFIKSYGSGSLATSSIRGGSAGHTLVLWNDIPIINPMLGLLDLSLIPISLIDDVSLLKGGQGSLWGSGAVSGTIKLDQRASFRKKLETSLNLSSGSFGQRNLDAIIKVGNKVMESSTAFQYNQAKNNFSYFIADNLPRKTQTNAYVQQSNFMQDIAWKLNKRSTISGHIWLQNSDRQIPPTNVQSNSEAYQIDRANRFVVKYKYQRSKMALELISSYINEDIDYYDPPLLITSESHFEVINTQIKSRFSLTKRQELSFGFIQNFTRAQSAGYDGMPTEWKSSLIASHLVKNRKWTLQTTIRQELVDRQVIPLIANIGAEYKFNEHATINARINKNYRLPTLNDRNWITGGNSELLPESGWSQELNYRYARQSGQTGISMSTALFNRNMDNWIMWIPSDNSFIWRPNNVTNVWSRGLEQTLGLTQKIKKIKLRLDSQYALTRSTSTIDIPTIQITAGNQLIYVPVHVIQSSLSMQWKPLKVAFSHRYTGKTSGVNGNLASYHIGNYHMEYELDRWKTKNTIYLSINNLWNTHYEVIERRPMVGRNFQIGIKTTFNK